MSDPGQWQDDPELARITSRQLPIFARDARTVCDECGLSMAAATSLYEDGLLGFDPRQPGCLDETCEAELAFLGALATSLTSTEDMRRILHGLSPPFSYDTHRIYYDWATRHWRLLPGEDDPEECFFRLLQRLGQRNERHALLVLRGWVADALELATTRSLALAHEATQGPSGH